MKTYVFIKISTTDLCCSKEFNSPSNRTRGLSKNISLQDVYGTSLIQLLPQTFKQAKRHISGSLGNKSTPLIYLTGKPYLHSDKRSISANRHLLFSNFSCAPARHCAEHWDRWMSRAEALLFYRESKWKTRKWEKCFRQCAQCEKKQSWVKDKDKAGREQTLFSGQVSTVTRKGILADATAGEAQGLECGQRAQRGAKKDGVVVKQSDRVKCRLHLWRGVGDRWGGGFASGSGCLSEEEATRRF